MCVVVVVVMVVVVVELRWGNGAGQMDTAHDNPMTGAGLATASREGGRGEGRGL